jgi:hypothetical protein
MNIIQTSIVMTPILQITVNGRVSKESKSKQLICLPEYTKHWPLAGIEGIARHKAQYRLREW